MRIAKKPPVRPAFTIVELLVAMALIVFIMYILAEAFAAGSAAFRNLKAIGDMNQRLRATTTTLRRYLQADHFDGRRRLSDPSFWNNGPPSEGFFRLVQTGGPSAVEGPDLDGISSAQTTRHALHFTVKLRGNTRNDFFRTMVPMFLPGPPNPPTAALLQPLIQLPFPDNRYQDPVPNPLPTTNQQAQLCSSWAEVAIFLRDTGTTTDDPDNPAAVPQSLFTMYLRQRLLMPANEMVSQFNGGVPFFDNSSPKPLPVWQSYLEVSGILDQSLPPNTPKPMFYFNNPADITMPVRRWGQQQAQPGADLANYIPANSYLRFEDEDPNQAGNDVMLQNVLSCHMSVLLADSAYLNPVQPKAPAPAVPPQQIDFVELTDPIVAAPYFTGNPSFGNDRVFDTWSSRRDDAQIPVAAPGTPIPYDYSSWDPRGGVAPTAATIPMFQHSANGDLIRIRAIRINLRIWDTNTKQTRQTSLIVDM